jgi:hypothetical protein
LIRERAGRGDLAGGLLILTWDEGSSDDRCCRLAADGHIVTILAGGEARPTPRWRVENVTELQAPLNLGRISTPRGLMRPRCAGVGCLVTFSGGGAARVMGFTPRASPAAPGIVVSVRPASA